MEIGIDVAKIIQERKILKLNEYKKLCEGGLNSYERVVLVPFMDNETFNYFIDKILLHSEHELDRTFIRPPTTYDDCAVGIIIPELRRRLSHVVNVLQKQYKVQGTEINC